MGNGPSEGDITAVKLRRSQPVLQRVSVAALGAGLAMSASKIRAGGGVWRGRQAVDRSIDGQVTMPAAQESFMRKDGGYGLSSHCRSRGGAREYYLAGARNTARRSSAEKAHISIKCRCSPPRMQKPRQVPASTRTALGPSAAPPPAASCAGTARDAGPRHAADPDLGAGSPFPLVGS
jgi:hypothetical protein